MKKFILATSLAVSLFAGNEYFVGVGLGKGSYKINGKMISDSNGNTSNYEVKDSGSTANLTFGMIKDNQHKIQFTYTTYAAEEGVSMFSMTLDYNYLLQKINNKITPFVGLGYEINKYEEDLENDSYCVWDKKTGTVTSNIINFDIGFDYSLDSKSFITFLFQQSISISGDSSVGVMCDDDHYTVKPELDTKNNISVYYNYKF